VISLARKSSGKLSFREALRISQATQDIGGKSFSRGGKIYAQAGGRSTGGVIFTKKELLRGQRRSVKMRFGSFGLKRMGL